MISFTPEEDGIIKNCIKKGHSSWNDDNVSDLKTKIKEALKERQSYCCCYCSRSFHGEFNFVIDIEHILPKHKYVNRMFELDNLAASCKRCNMKMKGRRLDFLSGSFDEKSPYQQDGYLFIHPNFDKFEKHIDYTHNQRGTIIVVKYEILGDSEKAKFSYAFFQLDKLEVHTNNLAQGIESYEDEWSGNPELDDDDEHIVEIFNKIESEVEQLALQFDQ